MRQFIFVLVAGLSLNLSSQNFPGQKDFVWPDYNTNYVKVHDSLKDHDAVILKEELLVTDDVIRKRCVIQIQNKAGAEAFSKIQLPENFDLTNPPNWYEQGRFKGRKDPFIYGYKIKYFSARIIKNGQKKFSELTFDAKPEKVCWVDFDGGRIYDNIFHFTSDYIEPGDIVEYMYEADVNWDRRQNVIYFNNAYPKFNYDLTVKTKLRADVRNVDLVYNYKVASADYKKSLQNKNGDQVHIYNYHFDYLKDYNTIKLAKVGQYLPSVTVNHGLYGAMYQNSKGSILVYDPYKWMLIVDTVKTNVYDKYHLNIRKFIQGLPVFQNDTSGNGFMATLVDTLNKLKFVTAESMNYGDIPQYALPSSEQLLKGRLTEEFIIKNYRDFLSEKNIYYYDGIIMDKRRGTLNPEYRSHVMLERKLIVLPDNSSFKYYVPRRRGVAYMPDELPFYFEGATCALMPCSHCSSKGGKFQLMFVNTPPSTFNENSRSESLSIKVNTDSMKMNLLFKENLSGQFSTLLRHYYNNQHIDSTVPASYYRKCTDKPNLLSPSLKKGSLAKKFPFRQTYTCSGFIKLEDKQIINLSDWFSFTVSGSDFSRIPNHDIYLDFQLSDYYNFLFEFDKPIDVININEFSKKIGNEYFEVSSNLVKQDSNKYLLSVTVKVKREMIPAKDGTKIVEFVNVLDEINKLKLNFRIL
jgi:hypothetical protein